MKHYEVFLVFTESQNYDGKVVAKNEDDAANQMAAHYVRCFQRGEGSLPSDLEVIRVIEILDEV